MLGVTGVRAEMRGGKAAQTFLAGAAAREINVLVARGQFRRRQDMVSIFIYVARKTRRRRRKFNLTPKRGGRFHMIQSLDLKARDVLVRKDTKQPDPRG